MQEYKWQNFDGQNFGVMTLPWICFKGALWSVTAVLVAVSAGVASAFIASHGRFLFFVQQAILK
ncbi:MAG: hypothetical protein ACJAZ0_002907 [Halioglobus sp.]|jgi:hypothetical protein